METCRLPSRLLPGTSYYYAPLQMRNFTAAMASPSPSPSPSQSENRMFVLGTGYVGQFFGQQLRREGWVVKGSCRSVSKKKELKEKGFDVLLFDANEPELSVLHSVRSCTHLLVSIPPLLGLGDPLLKHEEFVRAALMDGNLQWLCYLSSTGVYGDCSGAWVDEDYPANPATEAAKSRLLAENEWLNFGHSLGLSTQVFRLGGIYGPGRSAVDTVIKQQPLSERQKSRSSRQYTSRVHVEDICQALQASIKIPSVRRIYNIVDDDPAPREEVFAFAEDLVRKRWPGLIKVGSPDEEDMSRVLGKRSSRGEKRVSNGRMKRELGVKLCYPSYRSGLVSITEQLSL